MHPDLSRRAALGQLAGVVVAAVAWIRPARAQSPTRIVVYKSPTCGCCQKWIDHMNASGFAASVTDLADMNPIKAQHGIPPQLQSCHTTLVGGYVIEGHVPASDVKKLLADKPKGIVGLTIPGMPASAPGMDQTPFQPYDVLTFDVRGNTKMYARHTKG
jgi:hypothetical protein